MKTGGESAGRRRVLASVLIVGLVLFAIAILHTNKGRHAQQGDGPTPDISQSSNDYQQSSSPASGDAESEIHISISAENLLAEFQRSEANKELRIKNESLSTYLNDKTETAEDRYKGKRLQVTGIVTGVFIPSIETSRRVLESRGKGISDEQGGAGSFITMGGPYPHSVEETLLMPGIEAWSKTGDSIQPTFGQPNIESLAGQLVVGKEASILCTFRSSSGSSPTEISVSLEDCTLEPSPPLNTISPGIIITPLANDELTGPRGPGYRRMIELSSAGRAGTPDEVGTVGALLMGPEDAFITGSDFLMDGGVTAAYWYGELAPKSM